MKKNGGDCRECHYREERRVDEEKQNRNADKKNKE